MRIPAVFSKAGSIKAAPLAPLAPPRPLPSFPPKTARAIYDLRNDARSRLAGLFEIEPIGNQTRGANAAPLSVCARARENSPAPRSSINSRRPRTSRGLAVRAHGGLLNFIRVLLLREPHEDVDPFLFVLRLSARSSVRVGLIEESREKKKS